VAEIFAHHGFYVRRTTQGSRRVKGDQTRNGAHGKDGSANIAERFAIPKNFTAGAVTDAHNKLGRQKCELFIQPWSARRSLARCWCSILWWPALDHIGHEALSPGYARFFFEQAKQQLPASANKGFAAFVFSPTGRFPQNQYFRRRWTATNHHSLASLR
jgi:hypothetical protein